MAEMAVHPSSLHCSSLSSLTHLGVAWKDGEGPPFHPHAIILITELSHLQKARGVPDWTLPEQTSG